MFNYDEFKKDLKNNNVIILNDSTDSSGTKTLTAPLGMVRGNRPIIVSFSFDPRNTSVFIMAGVEIRKVTSALTRAIQRINALAVQESEPMQLEVKGNHLLCNRIIKNDGRYGSLLIAPLATQQTDIIEQIFNNILDI